MCRFLPSELIGPWNGTYDASHFGSDCVQVTTPANYSLINGTGSEDCLFLNLWVPPTAIVSQELKPVLFWVYGGELMGGGTSQGFIDGEQLASRHNVVVVTANYRIGPLGFLPIDPSGAGGMNGVGDLITALQWVQRVGSSFGADPARVLVFGQSAGASSACNLAVSPRAKGLLHRAITMSGPCVSGLVPGTPAQGWHAAQRLMSKFGVKDIEGLRHVDAAKFGWRIGENTTCYLDGADGVLPVQPAELYAAGSINVQSLVIGTTSFDGISELLPWSPKHGGTLAWDAAMLVQYKLKAGIVKKLYPLAKYGGSTLAAFTAADSDKTWQCPALRLARLASNTTTNRPDVWVYNFGVFHPSCDAAAQLGIVPKGAFNGTWASHAADINFVFENQFGQDPKDNSFAPCPWDSPAQQQLSMSMSSIWANMASEGKVDGGGAGALGKLWTPFVAGKQESVLEIRPDDTSRVVQDRWAECNCDFWENF